MVPPGYPTIPFGMWGSYAAAAAQQAQTQQQMQGGAAAAQQQQQQQQQSPTQQQAQAFGLAQQQAQMQQAMLAGYPGYFMNSMNSFMVRILGGLQDFHLGPSIQEHQKHYLVTRLSPCHQ
jgi:flagellar biosynthesis component FlhA